MKSLILFAVVLNCLVCGEAWPCGPDWTYRGALPYEVLCARPTAQDPEQFLAGVYAVPWVPGSGGVYRSMPGDTLWQSTGLTDFRVWNLKTFIQCPGTLFAVTSGGLYRTGNDGAAWDSISRVTPVTRYDPIDLAISPYDTNEWVCAAYDFDMLGRLFVSRDAGQSWTGVYLGGRSSFLNYSTISSGTLYFSDLGYFDRLRVDNSEIDTVTVVSGNIVSIAVHPIQPWYYVLGERNLMRYDESTGNVIATALQDSVGFLANMKMTPMGTLLVSGLSGIYAVAEDLSHFEQVATGDLLGGLDYASDNLWIMSRVGSQVYCRSAPNTSIREASRTHMATISVYPNPFNPTTQIRYDLPKSGMVTLTVFDLLGREVVTLVDQRVSAGSYTIEWNAERYPGGMYFAVLEAGNKRMVQKMLLMK